jgi:hypothetical protein
MLVTPLDIIFESNSRKIMLGIKKISAKSACDRKRDQDSEYPGYPSEKINDSYNKSYVKDERDERIVMPARAGEKRKDAHSKTEKGEIPEDHVQRMPHCKIFPPLAFAGGKKFLLGEDRIGADACAEKF